MSATARAGQRKFRSLVFHLVPNMGNREALKHLSNLCNHPACILSGNWIRNRTSWDSKQAHSYLVFERGCECPKLTLVPMSKPTSNPRMLSHLAPISSFLSITLLNFIIPGSTLHPLNPDCLVDWRCLLASWTSDFTAHQTVATTTVTCPLLKKICFSSLWFGRSHSTVRIVSVEIY